MNSADRIAKLRAEALAMVDEIQVRIVATKRLRTVEERIDALMQLDPAAVVRPNASRMPTSTTPSRRPL